MSKTLLRNPRVVWVDDDRPHGGGWFVTLTNGWAFEDAVPAGRFDDGLHHNSTHCRAFDTVREALDGISGAYPCHCQRCLGPKLNRD